MSFSATASSSSNWLTLGASTGTVPGSLTVSVNPSGLPAGNYTGAITLTAAGQATESVSVGLIVSAAAFTVSPLSLTFNLQPGSTIVSTQSLTIASPQGSAVFTATAETTSGAAGWLSTGATSFPAGPLQVIANAANLVAGAYAGSIVVSGGGGSQTVPVTAIVGNGSALTVTPSALTFTYQLGGTAPPSQTAAVTFSGTARTFGFAPSSAGGWLSVTASSPSTPSQLTISVNPSGLVQGTYSGSVSLALTGSTTQQSYPVTLIVNGTSAFTVSPSSFQVNYQLGDPNPNGQIFSLSGTASTFTATVSSSGNWLSVNPASGSVPATLSAGISPAGLAAGFYTGTISIVAPGETSQTVTVSLNVLSPQSLTLSPSSLAFTAFAGAPAPATQNITVVCPNSALSFVPVASSAGNWLSVSVPSVIGNNQIVVAVNPAGLVSGAYQGSVSIVGIGACSSTQNVPVTLTVTTGTAASTSSYHSRSPPVPSSFRLPPAGPRPRRRRSPSIAAALPRASQPPARATADGCRSLLSAGPLRARSLSWRTRPR